MTTYICKCGKTFQKNTEAGTTGLRMPDYGPGHECYGCPFVCEITTWDPTKQVNAVQNHECRGSKSIRYDTTVGINITDKTVATICTLDFNFLRQVHEFAVTLEGFEPDRYFFDNRSASYGADGRYRYTLYPTQNKKGTDAKIALMEHFFNSHGHRQNVTPEQEKEIVLNQIKEAKAVAQGKETPEETGKTYYHNGLVYFADQREESEEFTVFVDDEDHPCPSTRTEVATIPDFDTFAEAQNALNGLALKRGFSTERSTGGEKPEMEQQTSGSEPDENDDSVPTADDTPKVEQAEEMNELAGRDDIVETPGAENDSSTPGNENLPSDNDSGDSADDGTEQPPQSCDWKNASGDDEAGQEGEESAETDEVPGDPLSLRGHEFDEIVSTADTVLNRLVAMLHAKKQHDGEMTVKITFEDADGMGAYIFGGAVSGKINYTVKPQKVSSEPLELKFDAKGNPIVPADREHQLNFDEIQPGQREYPPSGGTAKVDGKTGIIEDYKEDGKDGENSDAGENQGDQPEDEKPEEQLYPCKNSECPFYAYDAGNPDASGCVFNEFDPAKEERDPFDVTEAVEQNACTRPEVLQAYADAQPVEGEKDESEEHTDDEC